MCVWESRGRDDVPVWVFFTEILLKIFESNPTAKKKRRRVGWLRNDVIGCLHFFNGSLRVLNDVTSAWNVSYQTVTKNSSNHFVCDQWSLVFFLFLNKIELLPLFVAVLPKYVGRHNGSVSSFFLLLLFVLFSCACLRFSSLNGEERRGVSRVDGEGGKNGTFPRTSRVEKRRLLFVLFLNYFRSSELAEFRGAQSAYFHWLPVTCPGLVTSLFPHDQSGRETT